MDYETIPLSITITLVLFIFLSILITNAQTLRFDHRRDDNFGFSPIVFKGLIKPSINISQNSFELILNSTVAETGTPYKRIIRKMGIFEQIFYHYYEKGAEIE